ncbi:MAG: hypothetical protein Fues2KO_50360 [Fuerstiella sp.]
MGSWETAFSVPKSVIRGHESAYYAVADNCGDDVIADFQPDMPLIGCSGMLGIFHSSSTWTPLLRKWSSRNDSY